MNTHSAPVNALDDDKIAPGARRIDYRSITAARGDLLCFSLVAELVHMASGRRVVLRGLHVIGRSRRSDLCIEDSRVSSQHASVRWTGESWQLSDLGSRNGTFHNDHRIEAGHRVALAVGALVSFGAREPLWRFDSDDPPGAAAEPLAGGAMIQAVGEMLALPDEETPAVLVYRVTETDGTMPVGQSWVVERDGQCSPVTDGAEIEAGGARFILHLPAAILMTDAAQRDVLDMREMKLLFSVSPDEEHVHLRARQGTRELDLESYAHHYTVLTLARIRQRDAQDPALSSADHGWIHIDDLANLLRVEESRLNVHIYRARRQLAKLGVANPASLIERRSYQRQLRLGIADIDIVRRQR